MTDVPAGAANALAIIAKAEGSALRGKRLANARSVARAMDDHGARVGLDQPHRLAQFLGQVSHESGGFTYDREVWGPTPAQKRYDTRTDLGNTKAVDGDGFLFRGRTGIQITGKANTTAFRDWCRALMAGTSLSVPDFVKNPDAMLTDPWEGLGPIWYWDSRKLNRYADAGDIEMVTKRINGGLNGYQDRINRTTRYSLVLLGHEPGDVRGFQKAAGLAVDGIAGPRTRAAMHKALVALTESGDRADTIQAAPVVEERITERETVPDEVDKAVKKQTNGWGWSGLGLGGIGTAVTAIGGWPWQTIALFAGIAVAGGVVALVIGPLVVRRVKAIRAEISA